MSSSSLSAAIAVTALLAGALEVAAAATDVATRPNAPIVVVVERPEPGSSPGCIEMPELPTLSALPFPPTPREEGSWPPAG